MVLWSHSSGGHCRTCSLWPPPTPTPCPCGPGSWAPHSAHLWRSERERDCMALLLLTGSVRRCCPLEQISRSLCAYKLPGLPSSGRGLCALTMWSEEGGRRAVLEASCLGRSVVAPRPLPVTAARLGTHLAGSRACYGVLCSYTATEPSVLFELYFFSLIKVCSLWKNTEKRGKRKDSTPKQASVNIL